MALKATEIGIWLSLVVWFQINEPSIPILWVMAVALIFGLSLALVSLLAPAVTNRSITTAQRNLRERSDAEIDRLIHKVDKLETQKEHLVSENLRLREINSKHEIDIEIAYAHITDIEKELAKLNNGDDSAADSG